MLSDAIRLYRRNAVIHTWGGTDVPSRMRTALIAGGLFAATAVPATLATTTTAAATTDGVTVSQMSLRSNGKPLTNGGEDGAISEDGKHVAFLSARDSNSTGTVDKLYMRHLASGRVESVCTSATGTAGNRPCVDPALFAHGRFVAFSSDATNLVPGDTNKKRDAFVKDLRTGKIQRVSTTADGTQVTAHSELTGMSADATKVVFTSSGALDPTHPPVPYKPIPKRFVEQVYVKDLKTGAVIAVSATADGTLGDDLSEGGRISPDGGTVAFLSRAANFGFDPTYYAGHIYLKDLTTGKLTALESLFDLKLPKFNVAVRFSAPSRGGTRLAFSIGIDTEFDIDVKPTDNTGVLVADLHQGKVIHVVKTRKGKRAHRSGQPELSADGSRVAFSSAGNDLVSGDKDTGSDTFVQTISSGTIRRLSVSTKKGGDLQIAIPTSISADGTDVVFQSDAEYLLRKKDPSYRTDVYVARF